MRFWHLRKLTASASMSIVAIALIEQMVAIAAVPGDENWSSLGGGVTGCVDPTGCSSAPAYAIDVSGTNAYVGGYFKSAIMYYGDTGVVVNAVAVWNGITWSSLGRGVSSADINGRPNEHVYALAVSGTNLYVGGNFSSAHQTNNTYVGVNNLARWDGNAWSDVGGGVFGGNAFPHVSSLIVDGSDLIVAGGFAQAGNILANAVAKWNGSTWTALGTGFQSGQAVVCMAGGGTNLYVGTDYFGGISKWDGSSWDLIGNAGQFLNGVFQGSDVYAIAVNGSDVYVGGDFSVITNGGNVYANYLAKWNGATWTPVNGLDGQVTALAFAGGKLYVSGWFTHAGGLLVNGIAKWDGSNWSALGTGLRGSPLGSANDVLIVGTNLYMAGSFGLAGTNSAYNVARYSESCTYLIDPLGVSVGTEETNGVVNVAAFDGCNWTATNNVDWITVNSGSSGAGNGTVYYSVQTNITSNIRNGTLTIGGQTFTVAQAGCSYSLSSTNASFGVAGGSSNVAVNTSSPCPWTATNNVNWIAITSGSSGTGNGVVNYAVASNAGNCVLRTGTLTVAGNTFTVTQPAGSGSYTISSTNASYGAGTASDSFGVTAGNGCSWTAISGASWITITAGSGTGNGTVNYTVASNTGNCLSRTGTVSVAGQTFTAIQAAGPGSYSIDPTNRSHGAGTESNSVTVSAGNGCTWTAISNAGWITITSGSSGIGNGMVGYAVQPNAISNVRTGTMVVAGQTFAVTQAGNLPPQVSIAAAASINWPVTTVNLNAIVTDDGAPYGTLSTVWSRVSGPGTVVFGNAAVANTTASFSTNGTYVLRLTANDGAALGSNDVTVIVNMRPFISSTPTVVSNALLQVGNLTVVPAMEPIPFIVGTFDPDGDSLDCQWISCDNVTNFDCDPTYVFSNCGPCVVSVTITDDVAAAVTSNFTVTVPCVLNITKLQASANFVRTNANSATLKGTVILPGGFSVTNKLVTLDVADAQVAFTLNRRGRGLSYPNICQLSYNKRHTNWTFTATMKRGAWRAPWAAYGMTNATVLRPGNVVNLPVILVLDTESFMGRTNLHYTARQGRSGTAR